MGYIILLLAAIGLSTDSLGVAAQKSLLRQYRGKRIAIVCALWFGCAQAALTVGGWVFGGLISKIYDYGSFRWLTCSMLALAGLFMIMESLVMPVPQETDDIDAINMFTPAVLTGVDSFLIGLLFVKESIGGAVIAALIIGSVTALASFAGVWIGRKKGTRYSATIQVLGGVLLIVLGVVKLLEELGTIPHLP